jgi:hypothetical protein
VRLKKNIIILKMQLLNKIMTLHVYYKELNRIIITSFLTVKHYSIKSMYSFTTRETKLIFSYSDLIPPSATLNRGSRIGFQGSRIGNFRFPNRDNIMRTLEQFMTGFLSPLY